jgi:hypothetical protein
MKKLLNLIIKFTKKLVITTKVVDNWLYFRMYFPRMSVSILTLSPTFFV